MAGRPFFTHTIAKLEARLARDPANFGEDYHFALSHKKRSEESTAAAYEGLNFGVNSGSHFNENQQTIVQFASGCSSSKWAPDPFVHR